MSRTGLSRGPNVPNFQPVFASGTCLESRTGLGRGRSVLSEGVSLAVFFTKINIISMVSHTVV